MEHSTNYSLEVLARSHYIYRNIYINLDNAQNKMKISMVLEMSFLNIRLQLRKIILKSDYGGSNV